MNLYRIIYFAIAYLDECYNRVQVNSQADWSIDNVPGESGNIRNYSVLCFVKLSNGAKKKKKEKKGRTTSSEKREK